MKRIDCDESFKSVLTDEGLCCTFNAIHPKLMFKDFEPTEHVDENLLGDIEYMTWSPESGYLKVDKAAYPLPVPGHGSNMGLTIKLDADVSNYFCSSTSSSGFKILVHSPIETPRLTNFGFYVGTGMETEVVITPKISEASMLIRNVPIQQRQCIFANEANLSFYQIYSKKNCEMECSSRMTEAVCGCTLYYMPRKNDNDSKICNRKKAICYEQVLYNIAYSLDEDFSCNYCLPACFEINYGREISSSKLGTGKFITSEKLSNRDADNIRDNLAIIHIFFSDTAYGGFTKNELFGFTEFLSNTGGLLGLFMGFSVISLVEILYFMSLRPYCAQKRTKTQNQAEDEDIEYQNKVYRGSFMGVQGKSSLGGHSFITEFEKRSESHKPSAVQEIMGKIIQVWRYVKAKIVNAWSGLVDTSDKQGGEGQSPFPYYN